MCRRRVERVGGRRRAVPVAAQPADLSTAVLACHVDDRTGHCRGCRRVSGRVVAWPCAFVRLAGLAQRIAEGDVGER